MKSGLRIVVAAVLLLPIVGFSIFGFMATYEYEEAFRRLPWQVAYVLLGTISLLGIAAVTRPRKQ